MLHGAEVHRCLVTADVAGLLRIRAQTQPHLAGLAPAEALIALHMARIEARFMPHKLRQYSAVFLAERGYRKVEGRWITDPQPSYEVISAAGIASRSADPRVSRRIVQAMGDAYLDAVAGGIDAAEVQKERMLKARARERLRIRIG